MRIRLNDRFRPFSHKPGISCLLPGTSFQFQFYPTKIYVHDLVDLNGDCIADISVKLKAPIEGFTVQQNLEKGIISVWGHAEGKYFCYHIFPHQDIWKIYLEKGENLFLFETAQQLTHSLNKPEERLSFGVHKAQCWDQIRSRCQMQEILPLWHRLALWYTQGDYSCSGGTVELLEKAVQESKENFLTNMKHAFKASIAEILVPRLSDNDFQGYLFSSEPKGSPIGILLKGKEILKKCLISQDDQRLAILPSLPSELHCGKYINIPFDKYVIDLEWSKKKLRRLVIRAQQTTTIHLHLPKRIKSLRLQRKGENTFQKKNYDESLAVIGGETYYLDRFES
ncbi:MAG: hypothetical protein Tsb0021_11900 [Chlamydiales bacterium]